MQQHAPVAVDRAALEELADAYRVAHCYQDYKDDHQVVSDQTLLAVLAALGVHVTDTESARAACAAAHNAAWQSVLPGTVVHTRFRGDRIGVTGRPGDTVDVSITTEAGQTVAVTHVAGSEERTVDGDRRLRQYFELPDCVPDGYHTVTATTSLGTSTATLLAVPGALPHHDAFGQQRHGGAVQLYSTLSNESWGVGDFGDLGHLATWAAETGDSDFMLINPVHASHMRQPQEPSPYLPTTRRFVHPLYLRVSNIAEYEQLPATTKAQHRTTQQHLLATIRDTMRIDRDSAWDSKEQALREVFAIPRTPERTEAFASYRADEGEGLEKFALWCALDAHFNGAPWPAETNDPNHPDLATWREKLSDDIEFYCWLQWQCAQQLSQANTDAKNAGMALGILHDLAVGVHPSGADAWALGDSLAAGVTVGAPPDGFNQQGQDWSQPPWQPTGLTATGYQAYSDVVRACVKHAGGVRMDHVMGLFRLWWIPAGQPASEGTYVYYDEAAMLGVVCLEASRAGAIVVGEDLGTVEPRVREELSNRGFLGTNILWFEQNWDGQIAPEHWRANCFGTVTTHDLPPTPSYLVSAHVDLRNDLGLLTRSREDEFNAAQVEINKAMDALRHRNLLPDNPDEADVIRGLHLFLRHTPAQLVGWSLTDAVGEKRTQNQPGTCNEYPNWRIPLAGPDGQLVLIDDLPHNERARELLQAIKDA